MRRRDDAGGAKYCMGLAASCILGLFLSYLLYESFINLVKSLLCDVCVLYCNV
jgi:hypothetical protein